GEPGRRLSGPLGEASTAVGDQEHLLDGVVEIGRGDPEPTEERGDERRVRPEQGAPVEMRRRRRLRGVHGLFMAGRGEILHGNVISGPTLTAPPARGSPADALTPPSALRISKRGRVSGTSTSPPSTKASQGSTAAPTSARATAAPQGAACVTGGVPAA